MPNRVQCGCGQAFAAEAWLAGQTVPCPACGRMLAIPRLVPGASMIAAQTLSPVVAAGSEKSATFTYVAIGAAVFAGLAVVVLLAGFAVRSAIVPDPSVAQRPPAPAGIAPAQQVVTGDSGPVGTPKAAGGGGLPQTAVEPVVDLPVLPIPPGGVWITTDDGRYEFWSFEQPQTRTFNSAPSYGITTTTSYTSARPNTVYNLLDSRVRRLSPLSFLDEAAATERRGLGRQSWEVIGQRRVKLADLDGIDATYRHQYEKYGHGEHKGERKHLRVLMFCAGNHLYEFMIYGSKADIEGEEATTIIGSFRRKEFGR